MILHGDSLDELKKLDESSIDVLISDPPYQLSSITNRYGGKNKPAKSNRPGGNDGFQGVNKGFMGKEWDVLPTAELLTECLRVLKPGAIGLMLADSRKPGI